MLSRRSLPSGSLRVGAALLWASLVLVWRSVSEVRSAPVGEAHGGAAPARRRGGCAVGKAAALGALSLALVDCAARPSPTTPTTAITGAELDRARASAGPSPVGATVVEGAPPAGASACAVTCAEANARRTSADAAARVEAALAPVMEDMGRCPAGDPPPPLVLRFDSGAHLTSFGVDASATAGGACIDAFRDLAIDLTYPGPAVLRCRSECGP